MEQARHQGAVRYRMEDQCRSAADEAVQLTGTWRLLDLMYRGQYVRRAVEGGTSETLRDSRPA